MKYFSLGGSASLNVKNVFEFKTVEDFWLQIQEMSIKKARIKQFTKNCYKSIEEAKMFLRYPVDERISAFNKVMEHQVKQKEEEKQSERYGGSSRNVERKSVDSALDTPATSAESPSSSRSSHEPTKDPIESYLDLMSSFSYSVPKETKREKKLLVTPKLEVDEESNSGRRRSGRSVKKRKFDDFQEDIKSEASETKTADMSLTKSKFKRQKVQNEETLEDRFIIESKHLRNIFYAANKKKACSACFEINKEPTFRCVGKGEIKCAGYFHKDCSAHIETKQEEIRHQTGDSDEIIQTSAIKTFVTCKSCFSSVKNCFICDKSVDSASEFRQCPNIECRLAFHTRCLLQFPQGKNGNNKRNNQCPQHTCHTCFSKDIHSPGPLIKCVKCPSSYHMQICCVPAGSSIISQTQLICPRHPSEMEIKRSLKDKSMKPVNIDWCTICNESGNLVCCDSCPSSFHYDCIEYEESEDKYICRECEEGRLPLYNTIVWARVGSYRWWPGLIMPNTIVPESVLKTQRFEREFSIRFFGSYDFAWFTCERVFGYDGTATNYSVKGNSKLDSAFNIALKEAHLLFEKLNNYKCQWTVLAKPKPYTKITQNRPIAPVKLKKADERTQDHCNCKTTDPNPCSRNSNCLNMYLNVECSNECPAGSNCQNQKLSKHEDAEIKIVSTSTRGFGALSVKDIPEDTFVIEYVGDLINATEFNKRMKAKIDNKDKEFYFLTVEGDLYVDAEPAGNLARFINHSCDPNCITRKITVDGNTRIGIFSNQRIKAVSILSFLSDFVIF